MKFYNKDCSIELLLKNDSLYKSIGLKPYAGQKNKEKEEEDAK